MGDEQLPSRDAVDALRTEIETLERRIQLMRCELERIDELPARLQIVPCNAADVVVGVPLDQIEHVVGLARLAPTNDAPPWIRGMLNIRGTMIPVVDVGVRFGHTPRQMDLDDLLVICSTRKGRIALWVDAVRSVVTVQTAAIDRNMPDVIAAPHLLGVAVIEGKPTYLLLLDAILGSFVPPGKDE